MNFNLSVPSLAAGKRHFEPETQHLQDHTFAASYVLLQDTQYIKLSWCRESKQICKLGRLPPHIKLHFHLPYQTSTDVPNNLRRSEPAKQPQSLFVVNFKHCNSRGDTSYIQSSPDDESTPSSPSSVILEAKRDTDLGSRELNVNWAKAEKLKEHYAEE